jgi:tetratricopeptide (TPR) repeat protein
MPRRPRGQSRAREKTSNLGQRESGAGTKKLLGRGHKPWILVTLGAIALLPILVLIGWLAADSPARLRSQAEAAARAGNWSAALQYWRAVNASAAARSSSHLGEARACLALGQAAQAELSLHRAIRADPASLEPWRLLLEILLVEDRTLEAQRLGWEAYDQIRPEARREVLHDLTLGLLADLPDEQIRTTLRRWVDADDDDVDAQIALWQRIATQPRAADPDRPSLLAALEALLTKHPDHVGARAALVTALADAGEPDRGRTVLDSWPESTRDGSYWRLRGRWDLEYDHRPEQAVAALRTALADLPQDWRSWFRLARALHILGRNDESQQAAETVSRIREILDPLVLGPRLHVAFDHLDDPAALRDLAALCNRAGLTRLADAWLSEARRKTQPQPSSRSAITTDPSQTTLSLDRCPGRQSPVWPYARDHIHCGRRKSPAGASVGA